MKPKNLDRWERIASKNSLGKGENKFFYERDLAYYLRKEHAWVVGLVKSNLALWEGCAPRGYETNQYGRDCRAEQCRDILDQLKRRSK